MVNGDYAGVDVFVTGMMQVLSVNDTLSKTVAGFTPAACSSTSVQIAFLTSFF
jgi:hypothetical protein